MLSKSQINFLKSLQIKKERVNQGLFLVEGFKSIIEFINSPYEIEAIYHTTSFDSNVLNLSRKINSFAISSAEMEKISSLKTPQQVAALVKIRVLPSLNNQLLKQKFSLVLDGIQDPGNLGTIIRVADWFGVQNIICSNDTVDVYNPKVVQASMGSLSRISVFYVDIVKILPATGLAVFGALMQGSSIYETDFGNEGLIVMGNEGNGMSAGVERLITTAVTIPRVGGAESLNVGIAAALFCSEINRKIPNKIVSQ
jgi:RNA methyltransferase, TrmH family